MNIQSYTILYNDQCPLVFVGKTYYNQMMYDYFSKNGYDCQLCLVEDIENNDQPWFDARRFIAASSNVATKRFITGRLAYRHPKYFSVVGLHNSFDEATQIGRGVFIENNNTAICNDIVIGDQVTITNYVCLGHNVNIGDLCHISAYSYLNFTTLGQGNCLASRVSIFGKKDNILFTSDNCNYLTGSTVTKTVDSTGTYYNNRRLSSETSVSYDIL